MRERPPLVYRQRSQHWINFAPEILVDESLLLRVQVFHVDDANAGPAQFRFQFFAPQPVDFANQSGDLVPDHLELLEWRPAIDADFGSARLDLLPQARHTHHKEFVDIRPEYRDKLDPLEQRIRRILRFFEHAPLKRKQAQVRIEVKLWRIQPHRRRAHPRRGSLGFGRCGGHRGMVVRGPSYYSKPLLLEIADVTIRVRGGAVR